VQALPGILRIISGERLHTEDHWLLPDPAIQRRQHLVMISVHKNAEEVAKMSAAVIVEGAEFLSEIMWKNRELSQRAGRIVQDVLVSAAALLRTITAQNQMIQSKSGQELGLFEFETSPDIVKDELERLQQALADLELNLSLIGNVSAMHWLELPSTARLSAMLTQLPTAQSRKGLTPALTALLQWVLTTAVYLSMRVSWGQCTVRSEWIPRCKHLAVAARWTPHWTAIVGARAVQNRRVAKDRVTCRGAPVRTLLPNYFTTQKPVLAAKKSKGSFFPKPQ
jgi:hypothetical protein